MYLVGRAASRLPGDLLQVSVTILLVLTGCFAFPAALLSARDCRRRSVRLSRDLVDGEVELWSIAEGGTAVRRLPHSGFLVDEQGSRRRRLERQPIQEVADVPLSAFWISIPPEETPPGAPPLERRRLGDQE